MKIERINENQIRCTLSREDLISRHIKLSELAYGSAKARELFRELMEQAAYQYGFEAEDIPMDALEKMMMIFVDKQAF